MPLYHPVQQNTEEWQHLRSTVPTASEMHRIVCPTEGCRYICERCGHEYTRKRKKCECGDGSFVEKMFVRSSAQANDYMYKLIAAGFGYLPVEAPPTRFMDNGHIHEGDAVAEYEFMTGRDTQTVGFVSSDDGLLGCSPDRLVEDEGLLECKCPSEWVHIRHMVEGDLEIDHRVQLQAQLLVTGRKWVDVISWCKGFPSVIIRVNRNEEFISGMNEILVEFVTKLHRTRAELIAKYGDFRHLPAAPPVDALGVSDEDLEMILAAQRTG